MLKSFVTQISEMSVDDLHAWLLEGLMATRAPEADAKRPAMAFRLARLSFGQGGDLRTDVDELADLYERLSSSGRLRFHQALAKAIDLLPVDLPQRTDDLVPNHDDYSMPQTDPLRVLDALIELGLDTQCNLAIDALIGKLAIPDAEARREVFLHAAFYLDERDAPSAVLRLAKAMLDSDDYPEEISARLLVALSRYDVENSPAYAELLQDGLRVQLESLRQYEDRYEEFRSDFAEAIKRAPSTSLVIEQLLSFSFYADLLRGELRGDRPDWVFAIVGKKETAKRWKVNVGELCAAAFRWLFAADKPLRVADSISFIDESLAAVAEAAAPG
jgi:hypothetical protein